MTRSYVQKTLEEARDHYQAGDLAQAELLYRTLLKNRPDHPSTNYSLAVLLYQQERFQDALLHIQRAILEKTDDISYVSMLGLIYHRNDKLDKAISVFRRILRNLDNHPETHYNLALALYDKNDDKTALYHLIQAIKIQPDFTEALAKLNEQEIPKENFFEVSKALYSVLCTLPKQLDLWKKLGHYLEEQDLTIEAGATYGQALTHFPEDATLKKAFEKISAHHPDLPEFEKLSSLSSKRPPSRIKATATEPLKIGKKTKPPEQDTTPDKKDEQDSETDITDAPPPTSSETIPEQDDIKPLPIFENTLNNTDTSKEAPTELPEDKLAIEEVGQDKNALKNRLQTMIAQKADPTEEADMADSTPSFDDSPDSPQETVDEQQIEQEDTQAERDDPQTIEETLSEIAKQLEPAPEDPTPEPTVLETDETVEQERVQPTDLEPVEEEPTGSPEDETDTEYNGPKTIEEPIPATAKPLAPTPEDLEPEHFESLEALETEPEEDILAQIALATTSESEPIPKKDNETKTLDDIKKNEDPQELTVLIPEEPQEKIPSSFRLKRSLFVLLITICFGSLATGFSYFSGFKTGAVQEMTRHHLSLDLHPGMPLPKVGEKSLGYIPLSTADGLTGFPTRSFAFLQDKIAELLGEEPPSSLHKILPPEPVMKAPPPKPAAFPEPVLPPPPPVEKTLIDPTPPPSSEIVLSESPKVLPKKTILLEPIAPPPVKKTAPKPKIKAKKKPVKSSPKKPSRKFVLKIPGSSVPTPSPSSPSFSPPQTIVIDSFGQRSGSYQIDRALQDIFPKASSNLSPPLQDMANKIMRSPLLPDTEKQKWLNRLPTLKPHEYQILESLIYLEE